MRPYEYCLVIGLFLSPLFLLPVFATLSVSGAAPRMSLIYCGVESRWGSVLGISGPPLWFCLAFVILMPECSKSAALSLSVDALKREGDTFSKLAILGHFEFKRRGNPLMAV